VRHFRCDFDKFIEELKEGRALSVLVAPSFYMNYPKEYGAVLGYLKSLGVVNFYSVSLGANITTWCYLNYISENKARAAIAQPCPVIVRHIEKHQPELIPNLIPVQSPMMATAIYLKKYMNVQEDFAFLSPCIAKKIEIESPRGGGLIRHNITFANLMQHIQSRGINLDDYPAPQFEVTYGMGNIFPKPGGLRENVQYYMGHTTPILQVEGEHRAYDYLASLATRVEDADAYLPVMVDIVNCGMGCCYGTGTQFRHMGDYDVLYRAMALREASAAPGMNYSHDPKLRRARLDEQFKDLNPEDFMCSYNSDANTSNTVVSEEEIETILRDQLMKLTDNDMHVDCSACGYKTCRHMAEAIALGINHHDNCVYYVRNSLTRSVDERIAAEMGLRSILDIMPLVTNIVDEEQNIINCNQEALRLFDIDTVERYVNIFPQLSPTHQPCGGRSDKLAAEKIQQALRTGLLYYEWMYRKPDGTPLPCDITLMRFGLYGDNQLLAFISDKREYYRNLENVRTMEHKLKAMLDASPILCAIYDENLQGIEANEAAATLFGLNDKQIYIERMYDLCPELQPCGTPSMQKARDMLTAAFAKGRATF
jgi:iron only hydrogenase large subunit-like protein